ncbi:MAG TPA: DUF3108 domain-containing protein [Stellaceae bacterium]|nr:DUF3108 domain-containing protein [Stellaceae bacterium]
MAQRAIGTVVGLMLAWGVGAAQAADAPLQLHYDIYSGGFTTVNFDVTVVEGAEAYRMDFAAHTVGVANLMFGFTVQSSSEGQVTADGAIPAAFHTSSTSHARDRSAHLVFQGSHVEAELRPPQDDEEGALTPVTPDMLIGTVDPLSGILGLARAVASGERCDRRVAVFDGRRRYDLVFEEAGTETLEPTSRSLFSGVARRCKMAFNRLGGYPVDTSKRVTGNDGMIWFATILPNTPPVPVLIMFDGRFGMSRVYLAGMSHGADIRKVAD